MSSCHQISSAFDNILNMLIFIQPTESSVELVKISIRPKYSI